jgi:putative transposase
VVAVPAQRAVVHEMVTHGLSERRTLAAVRMNASALRYTPAPDRNVGLRAQIRPWLRKDKR